MWAKGLWNRLNGSPGQAFAKEGPFGLPLPTSSEEARKAAIVGLNVELDALEKKLQVGGSWQAVVLLMVALRCWWLCRCWEL